MSEEAKLIPPVGTSDECKEPIQAKITGEVPQWLSGNLFRVGPGNFKYGTSEVKHFFDGDCIIHNFHIRDGNVTYRNKFLESKSRLQSLLQKRIVISQFGTAAEPDPCKTIFQRIMMFFQHPDPTDNCNVNLVETGDKLVLLTESTRVCEVQKDSLDTLKIVDFSKYAAIHTSTAHPHEDSVGNIISFGVTFGRKAKYSFFKLPPSSPDSGNDNPYTRPELILKSPSTERYPSYIHSFGMTDDYIILLENSLYVQYTKLAFARVKGTTYADCLFFDDSKKARFLVFRRDTGKLERQFVTDALFCFHHINAYVDDGHLVVDVCAYPDDLLIQELYVANIRRGMNEKLANNPKPLRFVFPLGENLSKESENLNTLSYSTASATFNEKGEIHCIPETLAENLAFELPRINYSQYNGKKYRYAYGSNLPFWESSTYKPMIIKLDVQTKEFLTWQENHCFPSESLFVANPEGTDEDDGVVLTFVFKMDYNPTSFLLILDGKTFKEVARASVDYCIPISLHGFFSSEQS